MPRTALWTVCALLLAAQGAWGGEVRPQAVSPGGDLDFALIEHRCPTFSWSGVEGARGHELAVYGVDEALLEEWGPPEVGAIAPLLRVAVPGAAVSWTPSLERCFEPGGRYAWFVRALRDEGASEWSEAKVFQVASPPSIAEVEEAMQVLRRYAQAQQGGLAEDEAQAGEERVGGRPPAAARERRLAGQRLEVPRPLPVEKPAPPSPEFIAAEAAAPTLGAASLTVDQQVHLGAASSVFKDGTLFLWDDASSNTALGRGALSSNTTGVRNTASGRMALANNTTGSDNTASGADALLANTTGFFNTASGDLALSSNTTGSSNTALGRGALFFNDGGDNNTALGREALFNNTGSGNTASGYRALFSNTTGANNTATGVNALLNNTSGENNTAIGNVALGDNTTGFRNTAIGGAALRKNTEGYYNTASGFNSLRYNTTGFNNTAAGALALFYNNSGIRNVAIGAKALYNNRTGSQNVAIGYQPLLDNTAGDHNIAIGTSALRKTTGTSNTAIGVSAMFYNTTGSGNVALGRNAGDFATTGDNNIFISNVGVAGDAGQIRIGTQGTQTDTFIAGISGTSVSGSTVVVNGNGQLGVAPSARRYKEEIGEMGEASRGILALRPVTFRYKPEVFEGPRPLEFGLIAEEVAELYPDLVAYDEEGQPFAVRYQVLIPMLLNELQKEHDSLQEQKQLLAEQRQSLLVQARYLAVQRRELEWLRSHLAPLASARYQPQSRRPSASE